MKKRWLRLLTFAAAVAAFAIPGLSAPAPADAATIVGNCIPGAGWGTLRPDLASAALDLVNQHRASIGLLPLKVSPSLTAAAKWKSLHMAALNYFDHYDLNYPTPGAIRDPFQRMAACGYAHTYESENIAYGYSTAASVVNAWLNSAGHRANIEGAFAVTGISAVAAANGTIFWTQEFGDYDDSATAAPLPAPGSFTAGLVSCNATAPQLVGRPPVVYGTDPSSFQYVLWRTNFWHWTGTAWQLAASTPYLVSVAYSTVPTQQWWVLPEGTYAGTSDMVTQTVNAVPPGGYWYASEEIYWLDSSPQVVWTDQVPIAGVTGTNAYPSYGICYWIPSPAGAELGAPGPKLPASALSAPKLPPHVKLTLRIRVKQAGSTTWSIGGRRPGQFEPNRPSR